MSEFLRRVLAEPCPLRRGCQYYSNNSFNCNENAGDDCGKRKMVQSEKKCEVSASIRKNVNYRFCVYRVKEFDDRITLRGDAFRLVSEMVERWVAEKQAKYEAEREQEQQKQYDRVRRLVEV